MTASPDTQWTPAMKDEAKRLSLEGYSRREVACRMGVTRMAVCGIIARMMDKGEYPRMERPKRPPKPKPLHKPAKPKTPAIAPWSRLAPRKGVQPPLNPEGRSRKAAAAGNGILLVDLAPGQCKWSIGYSAKGEHLFCAASQHENTPYCAEHHKRSI